MKVVSTEKLKELLLKYPKSPYARVVSNVKSAHLAKTGQAFDPLMIDEIPLPRTIYNAYFNGSDGEGIVGVECQIASMAEAGPFYIASLAMQTNVPGFFSLVNDVKVVLLVSAAETDDITIHIADAERAKDIERISLSSGGV